MERVVKRFGSFEEVEEADLKYYASLTPEQRMDILFELRRRHMEEEGVAGQRLERVYRIIKLQDS